MKTLLTSKNLAVVLLIFAILLLIGSTAYEWYYVKNNTFVAGIAPNELLRKIEPKTVPYDQIKPPAVSATDKYIIGSTTSSIGIIFYGDYTEQKTIDLLPQITALAQKHKGKVRLIWRDLPQTTEDNDPSYESAVISYCSRLLDANWNIHTALLKLKANNIKNSYLKELIFNDLNAETLYACWNDTNIRSRLLLDVQTSRGDGIDKAPFLFVGTQAIPADKASPETVNAALQNFKF